MRLDGPPDWVLTESHAVRTTVQAWRDGVMLDDDVPFTDGVASWELGVVPARLTLQTHRDYQPTDYRDPLAPFGQRLHLSQTLSVGGQSWTLNLGWFLVQITDYRHPAVDVEAVMLEQLLIDYRFESPYTRRSGDSYADTLRRLARGVLPVFIDPALSDRPVGSTLTDDWAESRIDAVRSLANNWPADIRVDDDGVLTATPERTIGTPVREWIHGEASAYVTQGTQTVRDVIYNAVVARGEDADGNPVQATAADDDPTSPTFYQGPFGRRPRFYESPLITTRAQARSAAGKILRDELRRTQDLVVDAPPDPRLEAGDTVAVTDQHGQRFVGLLSRAELPLIPDGGPARYVVSREASW